MFYRSLSWAALLLTALPVAATQEAMDKAMAAWQNRLNEYQAAVAQAATPEAKAAVAKPDGADLAPAIWQAVCGITGSEQKQVKVKGEVQLRTVHSYEFQQPWAAPAVVWLLAHPNAFSAAMGTDKPKQKAAFARAVQDSIGTTHYTTPSVGDVCPLLASGTSVDEYDTLEKIFNRNQNPEARACAALGLSLMLNNPMIAGIAGSDVLARSKRLFYLKQALLLSKEGTMFGDAPLAEVATEQAYRLRYLSPGCVPPQLKLTDMQGKECTFPAAGKVNLIFFWSPDESVGAGLVPRLSHLKQQYPELEIAAVTPFIAEEEREKVAQAAGSTPVYMDNQEGSNGRGYRISSVPTVILTAADSKILHIGYPDMRLQSALEQAFASSSPAPEQKKGSITIVPQAPAEAAPAPAAQPEATPAPANRPEAKPAEEQAPELREMPTF